MKQILYLFFCCIITASSLFSQTGSIEGTVKDKETGKALPNANIIVTSLKLNCTTDASGNFKLSDIPSGNYTITFSFIGYKTITAKASLAGGKSQRFEISLEPSPITLGDIIIFSTKSISLLNETPIPVEIVSSEEIKKDNSISVPDILQNEPGLALGRDGIWGTQVSIRGLSKSSIVTMVDGNRIETATDVAAALSLIDVNDIDRIEVIKGAASSLYGTGALGGVVNVISKSGSFDNKFILKGNVESGYSSVNNEGMGNLSLEAGAPDWFARINTTVRKADNTNTPRGILNNSQFADNNLSLSAGFRPLENQELILKYQNSYASNVGIPGGNLLFPANALVTYPDEQRQMLSLEYKIKNLSQYLSTVSAKYFYQDIYRNVLNIPFQTKYVTTPGVLPDKRTTVEQITPHAQHYTNGIQLESNWTLPGNNFLVFGLDAWQRNLDSRRERYLKIESIDKLTKTVLSTANQIVGEKPVPESEFQSMGAYAQDELTLIPGKIKIILGGRLDRINISNKELFNPVYTITNGSINNHPADSLQWSAGSDKNFSWSGNVGLLYSITNGLNINFSAAHSFRSPSLEERYQFIDQGNVIYLGNPNLNPEKGYFFDSGIKFWSDYFSITFDLFSNLLTDLVVQKPGTYDGRAALINTNIGKSALYGFDGQFEYNIFSKFVFYGIASYVRGEDTENHQSLPQIAPLNGKLGVRYSLSKYLSADLSSTIFAAQNKTAPGEISTPGYVYYDLYLSSNNFSIDNFSFQLFGGIQNIFNKAYRDHLATNRGSITIEPGRNIFVKIVTGF